MLEMITFVSSHAALLSSMRYFSVALFAQLPKDACWGGEVAALVLGWCTGGSLDGVLKEPDLE